jgi:S1-C subfamily serine protease
VPVAPTVDPARPTRRRWVAGGAVLAASLAVVGVGIGSGLANGGATRGFPKVSGLNAASNVDGTSAEAAVNNAVVDIDATDGYSGEEDAGTGMVITSNGDVLTNNHVVDGATSVTVTLVQTGQTFRARVLGTDATDDVALLKLRGASNLATIKVGDAGSVTAGIGVAAVGNALGRAGAPTVTTGSITGTGRSITASDEGSSRSESLSGMLETDADIVSGDSGGPLVDSSGQVIGMDTAANSGSSEPGIEPTAITSSNDGFAIPITSALAIARKIAAGSASATVVIGTPGFLGVQLDTQSADTSGALTVAGVVPDGPAATGGIAAGDTLTTVNGKTLSSQADLTAALDATRSGSRTTVGWTDAQGGAHQVTLTLAAGPAA